MKKLIKHTFLVILVVTMVEGVIAQEKKKKDDSTYNNQVKVKNTKLTTKLKLKKSRRKIRRNRIQSLKKLQRERTGKDIFGVTLTGFQGLWNLGKLNGSINAGVPSDSYMGFGAGALFDIQLAGGKRLKNGYKLPGKWYWHWGLRAQLDFARHTDSSVATQKRIMSELVFSLVPKYYFPMDYYAFSRKIPVLNRFHFFLGIGPMWSIAINDTIENLETRTFAKGPSQTDFLLAFALGFNMRINKKTYFTTDYRFGLNLTSDITDEITGKLIDNTGAGGYLMTVHTGFAYTF